MTPTLPQTPRALELIRIPDPDDDFEDEAATETNAEMAIEDTPPAVGLSIELSLEDYTLTNLILELSPAVDTITDKLLRDQIIAEFKDLVVNKKVPPAVAAKRVSKGLSLRSLALKEIQELMTDFDWTEILDRQLVRAGRRKIALEAIRKEDSKLALKALREIASDPLVGLTSPPVTNVEISLANVGKALETLSIDEVIDISEELR